MSPFIGEFIGTALLIILGNGVVANVVLNKTKGSNSGWIVITFGWAMAIVTAGFRCPLPPSLVEANTPMNTAMAQPNVMTIHPLLLPFVLFKTTFATTPLPRIINNAVPIN